MTVLALFVPGDQQPPTPSQPAPMRNLPQPRAPAPDDWILDYIVDPDRWGNRPGDLAPVSIHLPADASLLPAALQRALDSAYATHSLGGVDRFAIAVFGLDNYTNFVGGSSRWRFPALPQTGKALVEALRGRVADDRKTLWAVFEDCYKQLTARIPVVRERIQKAALQRLLHVELPRARDDILRETRRYLVLSDDSDQGAFDLVTGGAGRAHAEVLSGPEGPQLLSVLGTVLPYVRQVGQAETEVTALGLRKLLSGTAKGVGALSPLLAPSALVGSMLAPDPNQLRSAATALRQVREVLNQALMDWVAGFPVLYGLIDTETSAQDQLLIAIDLTTLLQEAWQASLDAAAAFKDDPALVWTLPILIDHTVRYGFDPSRDVVSRIADREATDGDADRFDRESAFAERVAADELTRVRDAPSALDCINNVLALADTVSWVFEPEFPIAKVVIGLAAGVAGIASIVKDYIATEPDRLTSRAAIDQSHSVSTASPYVSMMVKTVLKAMILLLAEQLAPAPAK